MKYLLILGNGFSVDLLSHLNQLSEVPLTNLIAYGDKLLWPQNNRNAFISFRNTPNLWILGARPSNSSDKNNQIIENVITCANAYFLKDPKTRGFGGPDKRRIYIDAYRELVLFLKYLFVTFDQSIQIDKRSVENWSWAKLFTNLNDDKSVSKVDIVTFNYDLWLERTLEEINVDYNISIIGGSPQQKFSIVKPHGSISFIHKTILDKDAFSINYDGDYSEGKSEDFSLQMTDLDVNTAIVPIVPPAGDTERFNLCLLYTSPSPRDS